MSKRRPLIIRHSELLSPLRRIFAFALTLAAWVVWALLLLPALWIATARLGIHVPPLDYFAYVDAEKLSMLLDIVPLALVLVLIGLSVLLTYGAVVRILRLSDTAPVSNDANQVVTDASIDPINLAAWQSARIVQVEHGEHGRVQDVRVLLPGA
jgi:poly-beta-1,6-N-acetyl-D-glucosamine biosynthesis protein PgaD